MSNSIQMLRCIKAFYYFTLNHQPLTFCWANRKDVFWAPGDISFTQRTHRTGCRERRLPSPPAWASMSEAATAIPEGRPSSLAASGVSPLPRQVPGGSTRFPGETWEKTNTHQFGKLEREQRVFLREPFCSLLLACIFSNAQRQEPCTQKTALFSFCDLGVCRW